MNIHVTPHGQLGGKFSVNKNCSKYKRLTTDCIRPVMLIIISISSLLKRQTVLSLIKHYRQIQHIVGEKKLLLLLLLSFWSIYTSKSKPDSMKSLSQELNGTRLATNIYANIRCNSY